MQEKLFDLWLERQFRKRNIKFVLCDLDDTLLETNKLFLDATNNFVARVEKDMGVHKNIIASEFSKVNRKAHEVCGVNPNRWIFIAEELGKIWGNDSCLQVAIEGFMGIYRTVPEWLPGAERTLIKLKRIGVRLGLGTHGNEGWSRLKIDKRNLRYIFEEIVVADENKPKGKDCWNELKNKFGAKGDECVSVGDNVKGDVIASLEAGITRSVLLPSPFHLYAEGDVPKGVRRIDYISQLPWGLLGFRRRGEKVYN